MAIGAAGSPARRDVAGAQLERPVLPHHLAADVVAVARADEGLDVDDPPAGRLEQQQLRVAQPGPGAARRARREHGHARDLVVEQPARDVDLVHRRVGEDHRRVEELVDADVAVRAVHQQRRADLPRVQAGLEVDVAGVVAAHEADRDQAAPEPRSASTIRSAAAAEVASGFSHSTGLPASRQASTYGSWVAAGEATTTASTAGSAISSSPSAWTCDRTLPPRARPGPRSPPPRPPRPRARAAARAWSPSGRRR